MRRARLFLLIFGLLAVVFLVVHPDVDPLDFRVDHSASHVKLPAQHQSEAPLHALLVPYLSVFTSFIALGVTPDRLGTRLEVTPSLTKLSTLRI